MLHSQTHSVCSDLLFSHASVHFSKHTLIITSGYGATVYSIHYQCTDLLINVDFMYVWVFDQLCEFNYKVWIYVWACWYRPDVEKLVECK